LSSLSSLVRFAHLAKNHVAEVERAAVNGDREGQYSRIGAPGKLTMLPHIVPFSVSA
jgi:hypothetical protein